MSRIRLFEPCFGKEEEKAVIDTLRSKNWANGAGIGKVKEFEENLKKYLKCKHVIAVNSGTAALHLALSLLDIKGKEVILPALSFVSTANAVLYNGGIPVFCDVDEDTLCLDYNTIDFTKDIACIIPVHFAGMKARIPYSVPIVEDSAHRIERDPPQQIGCYSFHPVKNLAMPTGGVVASNGDLEPLRARRWCGITDRKGSDYDVKELGWNYYMNEISAAIGIEQLKKLDDVNNARKDIAHQYIKDLNYKCMPFDLDCSYHLFWILVDDREKFRKKMADAGIETGTHYKPIDRFSLYNKAKLPVTDKIADKIVTLPIHPNLSDQDVERVIKVANS